MRWHLKGTVIVACNCDYGCPCTFHAPPTHGDCEGGWTWHVGEGRFGEAVLDGLNFSLFCDWPGAIHEGGGKATAFYDDRAGEAQAEAISTLLGGGVGGPWGVIGSTYEIVDGPRAVAYELELADIASRLRIPGVLELELDTIKNPVSGEDAHPEVVLPEGLIFRHGLLGATKRYRLDAGIAYDHSGRYSAVGPFEYSGP